MHKSGTFETETENFMCDSLGVSYPHGGLEVLEKKGMDKIPSRGRYGPVNFIVFFVFVSPWASLASNAHAQFVCVSAWLPFGVGP